MISKGRSEHALSFGYQWVHRLDWTILKTIFFGRTVKWAGGGVPSPSLSYYFGFHYLYPTFFQKQFKIIPKDIVE